MSDNSLPESHPVMVWMKTWKREVAIAQLAGLWALYGYGVAFPASPAFETAEALKEVVYIFVAGAFTLDWTSKQTR